MEETTSKPVVYYNGACPVCSFEINRYQNLQNGETAIAWRDIAQDSAALASLNISQEEALKRLQVIDGHGQLQSGVDAFLVIWRQLPQLKWLAVLVGLPVIKPVATCLYNHVLAPLLYHWNKRHGRA